MEKFKLVLLKVCLPVLNYFLSNLSEEKIRNIAKEINKKVDFPRIDEEAEEEIIFKTLETNIEIVKIISNNI